MRYSVLSLLIFPILVVIKPPSSHGVDSVLSTSELLRESRTEDPRPPILLIPGLLSSRLIAWKRKPCFGPDINIQDIVWLSLKKLVETMTYDKSCWIDCMKLGPNGTDPIDCKVRPDEGLSAIGELSPGNIYTPPDTSIFTALIKMLGEELGYDVNNLIGLPYDWRLAPIDLETRDSFFSTIKFKIETAVKRHRRPAIIMSHSMGTNLFMYFCDWLRYHDKPSMGWEKWIRRHIWSLVGFGSPLLGSPGALKSVLSGHTFGLTITEAQARELELTFPSTHFLNPRSSQGLFNGQDYHETLVSIESQSGGSKVSFGVKDVENGEMFRWVGNMFQEKELMEKYDVLKALYDNDPLKPLRRPYKRPPIKHVIMVYGVDIPTEVGYHYLMPDTNAIKSGNIAPILDEVLWEEPCSREAIRKLERSRKNSKAALDGKKSPITSDNCPKFDEASYINSKEFPNNLVKDICSKLPVYEANEADIDVIDSDSFDRDVKAVAKSENESSNESNGGSSSVKQATNGPISCQPQVYAIRSRKGQRQTRRLARNSSYAHTGDMTVAYLSLSFAKTWLEGPDNSRWEEYRPGVTHQHMFDSWAPLKKNPGVKSYDPPVEIFYAANKQNSDTTVVMEFGEVNHLDITKHSYVHDTIFEYLLPKMATELCINHNQSDCDSHDAFGYSASSASRVGRQSQSGFPLIGGLWEEAQKYFEKISKSVFPGV